MAPKSAARRGAAIALIASGLMLAGCGGVPFVGRGAAKPTAPAQSIGVNGFLWRASLDTLSFMPLVNADPQTPNERFKATVFILDSRLRADALNVSVTKQVKTETGEWTAAPVAAQTETDLENAILTKARQLNLARTR